MTVKDFKSSMLFAVNDQMRKRLIELLKASGSFDQSNDICGQIEVYKLDFKEEEYREIVGIGDQNGQVGGSFIYSRLLKSFEEQFAPKA